MAQKSVRVKKVELDLKGLTKVMKSKEISAYLLDVGEQIGRDADGYAGGEVIHKAKLHKKRKTRNVVNIMNTSKTAMEDEAEKGHLARAAAKNRKSNK